MKNIFLIIIILFLTLFSMNFVSAFMAQERFTTLAIKPEAKINMDILENYCLPNFCEILDNDQLKIITFKIKYPDKNYLILDAKENKNPEFFLIRIFARSTNGSNYFNISDPSYGFDISSALNQLISNEIISGLSSEDVQDISSKELNRLIYFKPSNCGDSYFIINQAGDLDDSGWLDSESDCELRDYNEGCPTIACCRDSYARGKLLVSFKNGTSKELINNLINSFNLKIEYFDPLSVHDTLVFTINVPKGEENKWKTTLEENNNVESVEFSKGGTCLNELQTSAGASSLSEKVLNLMPLPLKNSQTESIQLPILIFGIIGIAIIIIILFFVLRKKK